MFLDALLAFDPANTAITVTAVSTNVLDQVAQRDMGVNPEMPLDIVVLIQAAFTAAGAATLQTALQGAVDNGAGAPGTFFDFIMTGALPVANLTLGREILRTTLPKKQAAASNVSTPPRFYRLNYTVATGPMLTGQVQSVLIPAHGRQDNHAYPPGVAISN